MTAAAARPMFFKKDDDAKKKRRPRKTIGHHVQNIKSAPSKLRDRITQELYKRNAELAVRNKTLALLRKLDEISLSSQKTEDMAQKMVSAIAMELGYEVVTIAIVDEEKKMSHCVAIGSNNEVLAKALIGICHELSAIALDETPDISQVVSIGKQIYSDDLSRIHQKSLVDAMERIQKQENITLPNHSLILPLRFGEHTLGILTFSTSRSFQDASQYEHESLNGIVGLISLALFKAKLYEDLQRTSAQLAEVNLKLIDLDKAKSEFLSIASHQLYTPLTALRGYISMLTEGDYGSIPEEQKPILDILDKSAIRLIDLIKNLLDISRIESGRLELNLESLDLVEMAQELVADLLPNAMAKNLKLEFHPPKEPMAHVVVDKQRIRQVMLNFIDNSIKYTPAGKVEVYIEQNGDHIKFSVSDTGKGLATNDIDQLFHKFVRVGGAARFHTEGTGLGLYVAKQIVIEHHGVVRAESAGLNQGSTFIMELPSEGSEKSLTVGEKASVVIKAADAQKKSGEK